MANLRLELFWRRAFCCLGLLFTLILATTCLSSEKLKNYVEKTPAVEWMLDPIPMKNADAKTEVEMKAYTQIIPDTKVQFDMLPIPGGKFMMGSPPSEKHRKKDEGPQHQVEISPFWMGKCEVTWEEFNLWIGGRVKCFHLHNKSKLTEYDKLADAITWPSNPWHNPTFGMGKHGYPAVSMSQLSAKMYCKWLTAKTGHYYRLPTEAEWEYACRAGTKTAYSFGEDPNVLDNYAWHYDNSDEKYHKVGTKKPNPWGLHDMHGNVCEWVLDKYTPNYCCCLKCEAVKNPLVIPTNIYPRTVRGGSWDDDPESLRSAARRGSHEDWKMQDPRIPQNIWWHTDANFVGFRIVRPLGKPTVKQSQIYEPEVKIMEDYNKARRRKQPVKD